MRGTRWGGVGWWGGHILHEGIPWQSSGLDSAVLSLLSAQIQSLVRELGSHRRCCVAKKQTNKNTFSMYTQDTEQSRQPSQVIFP